MSIQNFNKLRVLSLRIASLTKSNIASVEEYEEVKVTMLDFAQQQESVLQSIFRNLLSTKRSIAATGLEGHGYETRLLVDNINSIELDYLEMTAAFADGQPQLPSLEEASNGLLVPSNGIRSKNLGLVDYTELSTPTMISDLTKRLEARLTERPLFAALETYLSAEQRSTTELIEVHDRLRVLYHNSAVAVSSSESLKDSFEKSEEVEEE